MHEMTSLEALPQELQRKIVEVLGIAPGELGGYALPVIIEELCDTALMCASDDAPPDALVAPAVKTCNAALGRHRLTKFSRRRKCRIVVGASAHFPPGWVATEVEVLDLLAPDNWAAFFDDGTIDAILAEHTWEHLTQDEGVAAARTCFRFLRPGGYVRVAVPDGLHPDPDYLDHVRPGGTGAGADDHKMLYTYESLVALFKDVGFEVSLLEYFDEKGAFQANDWNPADGFVLRSRRYDPRNQDGQLAYTSIIIDAVKP